MALLQGLKRMPMQYKLHRRAINMHGNIYGRVALTLWPSLLACLHKQDLLASAGPAQADQRHVIAAALNSPYMKAY